MPEWFNGFMRHIDEEDMAQIYDDPTAAREYFEAQQQIRAFGAAAARLTFGAITKPARSANGGGHSSGEDNSLYALREKPSTAQHFAAQYWPYAGNNSHGPSDDPDYATR